MKSCADRQEILLLDVHGELDLRRRSDWNRHLQACPGCRDERRRLLGVLRTVQENIPSAVLSEQKAAAMAADITRRLKMERQPGWWHQLLKGSPRRLIPVLAAASVMFAAFAWFNTEPFRPASVRTAANTPVEERLNTEESEIITNLELLEELEALEKLVQMVDNRKYGLRSPNNLNRKQRNVGHAGTYI